MKDITDISIDLLTRYNVQGPRYTSYPPAPSWKKEVGPDTYEKTISAGNQSSRPRPVSIYIHLPFCEKLCYFCGCTTLIAGKNRSFEDPYIQAVKKEIEWLGARVGRNRPVVQFHLGGGTPTFHSPETLASLMAVVKENFNFDPAAEVGIEVDPRITTAAHLSALRESGFNRISMGVQDFNSDVQQAVNRVQPFEETKELIEESRRLGFGSLNLDLIYGLPKQTPQTFEETVDKILSLNPDRLAVYSYAHVPWLKKHQDLLEKFLPSQEQKFEIFISALKKFTDAGYEYIGMDHFAKPDDELSKARQDRTLWRNFMGYTTKAGTDLFGLGMSAIGGVNGGFFQNDREIPGYQKKIMGGKAATIRGFVLSREDQLRAEIIQNLLCHAKVVKKEIEKKFDIDFDQVFADALEKLRGPEADGLVVLDKEKIEPTPLGRIFLRNLAMPFDAYLPKPGEKKVFSRTV